MSVLRVFVFNYKTRSNADIYFQVNNVYIYILNAKFHIDT